MVTFWETRLFVSDISQLTADVFPVFCRSELESLESEQQAGYLLHPLLGFETGIPQAELQIM